MSSKPECIGDCENRLIEALDEQLGLREEIDTLRAQADGFYAELMRLRAAAELACTLLSKQSPESIADCDSDAWDARSTLLEALGSARSMLVEEALARAKCR